jgi:uncharacterized membrane protein
MSDLVVIAFPTEAAAEEVRKKLLDMQQGYLKMDTAMLNQMNALVSAQGYSLTNKVLQTCNGWLMEAKRADGSPAVVFVDPKAQTIVDADFR